MRKLLLVPMLLMAAACTVGPDYKKPVVSAPEKWGESQGGAPELADTQWWKQFGDPVLDALIEETLKNNLDLQLAAAKVEQYSANMQTISSGYYPEIGAAADGSGERFQGNTGDRYRVGLSAKWELDLWGKVKNLNTVAKAQFISSEAGRKAVLMSLVSNLASSYISMRGLDRQLEISRDTEKAYLESFNIFKLRYQYGTISLLELSQVESQYESARGSVPRYESLIRQQENLISLLKGGNPGPVKRGKNIEALIPPQVPSSLPSTLMSRRPDIIQAEQDLIAANASIGIQKSAYFPNISISGLLGVAAGDVGKLFSSKSDYWSATAAVYIPLFTFGRIEGEVKQAEALEKQSKIRYQQAVMGAFREVEDALVISAKGREQLESQRRQVESLKKYAQISKLQFDAGTANYLHVLDADRSFFSGQLSLVQGQTDLLNSLVAVYKAIGGGWVEEADKISRTAKPGENGGSVR